MTSQKSSTEKPAWLKMKEQDIIKIIAELSEKYQPAQIGLVLRDNYGIPTTKIYGKKLLSYLKELGKNTNPELENAGKKVERMKEHLKSNVTDRKAKHKLQKAQSRLNVLKKYYSDKKR